MDDESLLHSYISQVEDRIRKLKSEIETAKRRIKGLRLGKQVLDLTGAGGGFVNVGDYTDQELFGCPNVLEEAALAPGVFVFPFTEYGVRHRMFRDVNHCMSYVALPAEESSPSRPLPEEIDMLMQQQYVWLLC